MGKEVDVKVDWEVDEVGEDVPIFRMNKNVFFWKLNVTLERVLTNAKVVQKFSHVLRVWKSTWSQGLATQCKA